MSFARYFPSQVIGQIQTVQPHIHHRPKTEYQNLSPYRAAASPQPTATARSAATKPPRLSRKSSERRIPIRPPKRKPQTNRTQNSSQSVFGGASLLTVKTAGETGRVPCIFTCANATAPA